MADVVSKAGLEKSTHEIASFLLWVHVKMERQLHGWDPRTETFLDLRDRLLAGFAAHPDWSNEFYSAMARINDEFQRAKTACEAVL